MSRTLASPSRTIVWRRNLLRLGTTSALLTGLALSGAPAQSSTLIRMEGLTPGELRTEAFVLDRSQTVRIEAVGAEHGDGKGLVRRTLEKYDLASADDQPWQGNAWILDARTRRVVWELRRVDTDHDSGPLRTYDGTVRLGPGAYEAYYANFPDSWRTVSQQGGNKSWFSFFRNDDISEKFRLTIVGDGSRLPKADLARARSDYDDRAIVSLRRIGPSSTERAGFTLDRPTKLEIYAIGEEQSNGQFDYGWIVNADTRQKVWELRYDSSEPAGGAAKNRMERRQITLPAGRYGALYATDDSHDPRAWNSAPPYDPEYYGLTVRLLDDDDRRFVRSQDYDVAPSGSPVVALTRMVNSDSKSSGFSLNRPADVRVYAIGEGVGDHMADYGWIVNADTHARVWAMKIEETEHAGGAEKNRMIDRVVHLDAGSYLVYYVTDDSHSYEDWNAAPPVDAEHWGISVYPARESDRDAFEKYVERRDDSALASIVRVRDDENRTARFSLDDDTDVNVYAIGEGSDGDMYDFAWIEDARTHRRVWTMDYGETEHAGGAKKNRQVNRSLRLSSGDYILHYKTDDSHSFGGWNQDPPDDPEHYGVTVSIARRRR